MLAIKSTVALALAAAASVRGFDILQPNPDAWWVAGSVNLLVWNCNDADTIPRYTVFAVNPDLLTDRTALIGQLDNTECSHGILQNEVIALTIGKNYVLQFTDPVNNTNVLATSQPFEVRAAGSPYSTVTATPRPHQEATPVGNNPSQTGSSGSSPTKTPGDSAVRLAGGVVGAAVSVFAAVAALL